MTQSSSRFGIIELNKKNNKKMAFEFFNLYIQFLLSSLPRLYVTSRSVGLSLPMLASAVGPPLITAGTACAVLYERTYVYVI